MTWSRNLQVVLERFYLFYSTNNIIRVGALIYETAGPSLRGGEQGPDPGGRTFCLYLGSGVKKLVKLVLKTSTFS